MVTDENSLLRSDLEAPDGLKFPRPLTSPANGSDEIALRVINLDLNCFAIDLRKYFRL